MPTSRKRKTSPSAEINDGEAPKRRFAEMEDKGQAQSTEILVEEPTNIIGAMSTEERPEQENPSLVSKGQERQARFKALQARAVCASAFPFIESVTAVVLT
jgi:hypothetical protein